jgi:hypothetical protein
LARLFYRIDPTRPPSVTCGTCSAVFSSPWQLLHHVDSVHGLRICATELPAAETTTTSRRANEGPDGSIISCSSNSLKHSAAERETDSRPRSNATRSPSALSDTGPCSPAAPVTSQSSDVTRQSAASPFGGTSSSRGESPRLPHGGESTYR